MNFNCRIFFYSPCTLNIGHFPYNLAKSFPLLCEETFSHYSAEVIHISPSCRNIMRNDTKRKNLTRSHHVLHIIQYIIMENEFPSAWTINFEYLYRKKKTFENVRKRFGWMPVTLTAYEYIIGTRVGMFLFFPETVKVSRFSLKLKLICVTFMV